MITSLVLMTAEEARRVSQEAESQIMREEAQREFVLSFIQQNAKKGKSKISVPYPLGLQLAKDLLDNGYTIFDPYEEEGKQWLDISWSGANDWNKQANLLAKVAQPLN